MPTKNSNRYLNRYPLRVVEEKDGSSEFFEGQRIMYESNGFASPPKALECDDPVIAYKCATLSHIWPTGSAYSKLQRGCSTPERYARPRHTSGIVGFV